MKAAVLRRNHSHYERPDYIGTRIGDFSRKASAAPIDLFTQQPFSGESNSGRADSIRSDAAIANLYPLPNRDVPGQNFISSPVLRDRPITSILGWTIDLGESSDFALRYSCADRSLFEPFAGPAFARIPGFGNDVERRAQNVMASETHVFTPQLINEVRLGFNRIAAGALSGESGCESEPARSDYPSRG